MEKLIVSTSPHIRTKISTTHIMGDVLIALSPAAIASVVFFGLRALLIIAVCVATCVASEFLFNLITKKKQTVKDLSAAVTGLILALCLPVKTGIWECIVGSVFAIIVVKCLFGGIGCNFANPAATARVLLLSAFSGSVAGGSHTVFQDAELVGGATPLDILKAGDTSTLPSLLDMFIGNRAGSIGETCAIALIIGFVYLVARKVISFRVPVIYIGTVFLLSLIIELDFTAALYQVLGGGLLIGAIFMATDYTTSPINKRGKMVFALGCGLFTVLFRYCSKMPEGVSYAILIMNILSPYIEKLCTKAPLGKEGKKK
ncbi:MAG: RnfABCDGE type electron transport complex subunit D [Clostridia bacterium]|nr:RnfABCDGE type electron transport complex subunit D [Clostridia bacterium]